MAAALLGVGAALASASLEHADRALAAGDIGVVRRELKEVDEEGAGGGEEVTGPTIGPETVQPTVVPTVMPTKAIDPAEAVAENDWEQVVSYYQSLQLCLQEVRRRCPCAGWALAGKGRRGGARGGVGCTR